VARRAYHQRGQGAEARRAHRQRVRTVTGGAASRQSSTTRVAVAGERTSVGVANTGDEADGLVHVGYALQDLLAVVRQSSPCRPRRWDRAGRRWCRAGS
jgi:hypothetical protein